MKYITIIICLFIFGCSSEKKEQQYVILISFDGFRHDYVSQFETPNFDDFIKQGTASEALIPAFPSKTFPNHYSIVTGLYPANHGIIDNKFYDPKRRTIYHMGDREKVSDSYYYGGEPIWSYIHGFGLKSASFFWVGSEMKDTTRTPDYTYRYDAKVKNEARIEQAIDWLQLAEGDRPQLICLYFSLIDSNGHRYGPLSKENEQAIQVADSLLGKLMNGIKSIDLPVNVIITSDHGMRAIENKAENFINLTAYYPLENKDFFTLNSGTHAQLYFKDKSKIDSTYASLSKFDSVFKVFRKGKYPAHWNYNSSNNRIGDLLIAAPYGKNLSINEHMLSESTIIGAHGYDPTLADMHGIFYANGPAIKEDCTLSPVENVAIYPLMCKILNVAVPKDLDGDLEISGRALKKP